MSFTLIRQWGSVEFGTDETGYAIRSAGNTWQVTYEGGQASDSYPGGGLVGIGARSQAGGFELVLSKGKGGFVSWSLNSSGTQLSSADLSLDDVRSIEEAVNEDINGDGTIGTPEGAPASDALEGVSEQGRQATHLLGSSPEYTRTFRVYLNGTRSADQIIAMCGVAHGQPHPDQPNATVYSVEIDEAISEEDGGQLVALVTAKYKVKDDEDTGYDALPWERGDTWKFQTQGVAVPALTYYQGTTPLPLTNSAGDFFEGVTVDEAQQKITITGNRQSFPSALAAAITNCVNDSTYLGFAANCIKVQGISGEPSSEVVDGNTVWFWKVTVELLARQSGWNLLLPDVGFNFIEGGEKKRAMVKGPDGEDIASANPVALNGNGGQQPGGQLPAILDRRIYKQITFSTYFGS